MRSTGWRSAGTSACILLAIVSAQGGVAWAVNADWKFYGGVSSPDGRSWCVYDANRVVRAPVGHITVATECLPQTEIDKIDIDKDFGGKIAENVARRTRDRYRPPYARAETIEEGEITDIIRSEQIADIAGIQPRVKISHELDCRRKLTRTLSIYVQVNGNVRSVDTASEWKPISPEANIDRLFKILCAHR